MVHMTNVEMYTVCLHVPYIFQSPTADESENLIIKMGLYHTNVVCDSNL